MGQRQGFYEIGGGGGQERQSGGDRGHCFQVVRRLGLDQQPNRPQGK